MARDKLAVVYPEVPSPANLVFEEIIAGIEASHPQNLLIRAISRTESPDESLAWVNEQQPDMLIALGKRGYRIAKYIYKERPVAIGALPIRPNGISGISLLADPGILFDSLKNLAPDISVINVVYSPSSRWLMSIAAEEAAEKGLELKPTEVKNIKEAISTYDALLKEIDPSKEAVWVPVDKITAHEQVILPSLLEKSWEQNLVLFSSKPAHAKRGALFSVFPDNQALGQQLVKMVTQIYQSHNETGVVPLQDMKLAVNLRTAAHLGFDYKSQQKEQFHLTFPQ
ncbi:ABC transporter substrate binding protein [Planctobacterium marinum]